MLPGRRGAGSALVIEMHLCSSRLKAIEVVALLLLCSCEGDEFTRTFERHGWQEARAVALLPQNQLVFGGLDQGDPANRPDTAALVSSLSGTGTTLWEQRLAVVGSNAVTAIAFSDPDALLVGGWFSRELGPAPATRSRGGVDAFVARLSPVDGAVLRIHSWGGAGADRIDAVAALQGGAFLTSGVIGPDVDLGLGVVTPQPGQQLGFVARYGPDGPAQWVTLLSNDSGEAVAVTAMATAIDRYAVAGTTTGRLTIGAFTLEGAGAFVASGLTSNGQVLWARLFSSTRGTVASGLALSPEGRVALSANASGAIIGAGTSESSQSGVVVEYDGAGVLRWVRAVNTGRTDSWPSVRYLQSGQLLTGVSGGLPKDAQRMRRLGAPEGDRCCFMVELTGEGEPVAWAARGPDGPAALGAMDVSRSGRVASAGVIPSLAVDAENPDIFIDSFSWSSP